MSLRLLPASGSTLPPKRNGDVIQPLRLVNPSGVSFPFPCRYPRPARAERLSFTFRTPQRSVFD